MSPVRVTMSANLASHFGSWTAMPVASYQTGQLKQYSAAIYVGSTYGEPLPTAFLDDVYATTTPVIWAYDNIWQLTARYPNFSSVFGWNWSGFDFSSVAEVDYPLLPSARATQKLSRYSANGGGIMNFSSTTVTASTIARNFAQFAGGGIYHAGSNAAHTFMMDHTKADYFGSNFIAYYAGRHGAPPPRAINSVEVEQKFGGDQKHGAK